MEKRVSARRFPAFVLVVLVALGVVGAAFAKSNPKISVADDPSLKVGNPEVVLIEMSDYQ